MTKLTFARDDVFIDGATGISRPLQCLAVPATLYLPSVFTTCDITFLAANAQGGTYCPLKDNTGSLITASAVEAGDCISLDPGIFNGIEFLRIVCSVPQAVELLLVYTPVYGNYLS